MGLKPKWWGAFADELKRHSIRIRFKCLSRADLVLREGAVADLARAGCDVIWLGAESGSQKILDAMDKGLTVEQIEEATRRLKDAGIRVGHFIQFGYSGEGIADIARTIRMIRKTQPDELGISVSYPLPGTVFYERVKAELQGKRNWSDSSDLAMLYRGPFTHHLLSPSARLCASRFQDAPRPARLRPRAQGARDAALSPRAQSWLRDAVSWPDAVFAYQPALAQIVREFERDGTDCCLIAQCCSRRNPSSGCPGIRRDRPNL